MIVLLYDEYNISCKRKISRFFNVQHITGLYNTRLPDAYVHYTIHKNLIKIITCAKVPLKITNREMY